MYVKIIFETYLATRMHQPRHGITMSITQHTFSSGTRRGCRLRLNELQRMSQMSVSTTLELLADIRHLLVNSLLLQFTNASSTYVRNELRDA